MLLRLIRKAPQANAVCGTLFIDDQPFCSTLERADVAIPAGFYPVTLTMSPRFGEILPLIGNVVGYARFAPAATRHPYTTRPPRPREGIRIHTGNTIRDTAGCILVGIADTDAPRLLSSRRTLNALRNRLLTHYHNRKQPDYEPIHIEIIDADPYPLYDVPCPIDECMHIIEAQCADTHRRILQPNRYPAAG